MARFTVNFVIRDWVTVDVSVESEEVAKTTALEKIEKSGYKDKAIDIIDGKTEYAGITLNDIVDQLN